jgi:hypothetical protein
MRTFALGTALVLAGVVLAQAEGPAFTIKIKTFPDKGQPLLCHDTDRQSGSLRFIDTEGNILDEQKPVEESEEVYRLSVLEDGSPHPRRYQQSFGKAVTGNGKRSQSRGYQNETVTYELTDGKYQVQLGAKADVTQSERAALASRANGDIEAPLDDIFQPGKAVKVGEAWEVSGKLLNRGFGHLGKLDMDRTRGEARLIKAYTRGGKQFGVIVIDLILAYSNMDQVKFNPPAIFRIRGSLDTAIDGSSAEGTLSLTSKLSGKTVIEQKGAKVTLLLSRNGNVVKERTAIAK